MIEEIESLFKKFQLFPITNAKIHSRFHSQFKAKLESIRNYMNQITNPNSLISKKVRKKDFFSTYTTFLDFLWNLFQSSILYFMPCTFIIGKLNNPIEDIWWRCNNQKQIVMSSFWKEKQYINSCKLPKIFCEEIKHPSSEIIWPFCENGFPLSGNSKRTFFLFKSKTLMFSIMFYFKLRKPLRVSQF